MKKVLIGLVLVLVLSATSIAYADSGLSYAPPTPPAASVYNYKTQKYETVYGPLQEAKIREYVPQSPSSLALYDHSIKQGKTPLEAMEQVLRISTCRSVKK